MKTKFTISILLCLFALNLNAQDIILKKNGEKLTVVIKEVSPISIKYYNYKDPNQVLFTIDKTLINKINFAYGNKLKIENPENDPYYFSDNRTNNLLVNFSSFTSNTLGISYEKALKQRQSVLVELKIYGLGNKGILEKHRNGVGLDVAYRLKIKSLFKKPQYKPKHILSGSYFSPIIGFSTGTIVTKPLIIDNDDTTAPDSYTTSHTVAHFGLQYGRQWIIENLFSIDTSIGYHYYLGSVTDKSLGSNSNRSLRLGNMIGNENVLLSFNLRVGFLFGRKTFTKK
jgi:hypothetical protein